MSPSCLTSIESFALYFEGRCTHGHLLSRLQLELTREAPSCPHSASQELQYLLDVPSEAEAKSRIEAACQYAFDNQYQMAWEDVTRRLYDDPLFDSIYYDGGGYWNEYYETGVDNRVPYVDQKFAQVLRKDGSRIDDVYEAYAREQKIECKTPLYVSTLRSPDGCALMINNNVPHFCLKTRTR